MHLRGCVPDVENVNDVEESIPNHDFNRYGDDMATRIWLDSRNRENKMVFWPPADH